MRVDSRPCARNLTLFSDQIKDGTIDLNPEYQRGKSRRLYFVGWTTEPSITGVVWSLSKQVALIDSIFKHYYVPPVILGKLSWCYPATQANVRSRNNQRRRVGSNGMHRREAKAYRGQGVRVQPSALKTY